MTEFYVFFGFLTFCLTVIVTFAIDKERDVVAQSTVNILGELGKIIIRKK